MGMQDVDLEQPFTAHLQVHNASSDPVEDFILSLPAEEIPGLGMRLMVSANLPYCTAVQPFYRLKYFVNTARLAVCPARLGEGGGGLPLAAIGMHLLVALYKCSACLLGAQTTLVLDMQGLPGDVHGELQPLQSKTVKCDFLPLHEGLVRFPLLQLMSSGDGRIHDVLAEDAYVTAGGE